MNKKNKPTISIIVPTKQAASHLKLLFDSLTKQTFKSFEVIVNNDTSAVDDTKKLIDRYKNSLDIVYIEKNTSMALGRLNGAKVARGKYLYHIDADMHLHPKLLKDAVEKLSKGFEALVVPEVSFGEGFWSKVKAFERTFYLGDEMMESSRIFDAKAYWSVGGHDGKMVASEDKDIHLKIKSAGYKMGRTKYPVYHNEGRMTLIKTMKKKYFYGKSVSVFTQKHTGHAIKQANTLLRPAYFRDIKKILKQPVLSLAMFTMKIMELLAVVAGIFVVMVKPKSVKK